MPTPSTPRALAMSRLAASALLAALVALPAAASAQTSAAAPAATQAGGHGGGSGWAELDAFHAVMAASWHPAARANDVAPARARLAELADRAQAWSKTAPPAAAPAACRAAATPQALARFAAAVADVRRRGADDAALKAGLKGLHARFEVFEAACGGEGEHGHH